VTNGASDFRLGGQSGLNAYVAETAAFDPFLTCGVVGVFAAWNFWLLCYYSNITGSGTEPGVGG